MKMTISVTDELFKLIEELSQKTGLKKSTLIRIAVIEWSKNIK